MSAVLDSELEALLADWDGRTVAGLAAFHARRKASPGLVEACLARLGDPARAAGASWLLKRHLETVTPPDEAMARHLCRALARAPDWQSRLHLLQALDLVNTLPADCCEALRDMVTPLLADRHKFTRAWAFNALGLLARARPDWRPALRQRLEQGLGEESGAVAARIRRLLQD